LKDELYDCNLYYMQSPLITASVEMTSLLCCQLLWYHHTSHNT